MPIISGGGAASLGSVTGVTGTAASGQVPVASSSSASAWGYPPGFEIGYVQITAGVTIASTTEATGTTIINMGALTFDGTAVLFHFFAPVVACDGNALGNQTTLSLFEGSTQIGRIWTGNSQQATTLPRLGVSAFYRFTPSAASHTYTVTAFVTNATGSPNVGAGSGGTGAVVPAFGRFTKV